MNIDKKILLTGTVLIAIYFVFLNIEIIWISLLNILSAMSPFLWAGLFLLLLNPLTKRINKKIRNEKLAATLSIVFFVLFIVCVLILIIPQLITSATQLITMLKDFDYISLARTITDYIKLDNSAVEALENSLGDISKNLITLIQNMLPSLMNATVNIANNIINFLTGIIITWYILSEKTQVKSFIKKVVSSTKFLKNNQKILSLWKMSIEKFNMFFSGKIIDSLIVGVICFIFMLGTKMEYSVLISLIIGITNIIPFFGPFIGAIPSIFILLISNPINALIFAIFILVLQQIDGNIIGPKILGDSVGVSKIGIIFAIIVGGNLFGVIGMIVGVPVFAIMWEIISQKINNNEN